MFLPAAFSQCPMVVHASVAGPQKGLYTITCADKFEMTDKETNEGVKNKQFRCSSNNKWSPFTPQCIPGTVRLNSYRSLHSASQVRLD